MPVSNIVIDTTSLEEDEQTGRSRPQTKVGIHFDLGDSTYGKFGKFRIKVNIPFIGDYNVASLRNGWATQRFLEEELIDLDIVWANGEAKRAFGPRGWIRTGLAAVACSVPTLDISTGRMKAFVCFYLGKCLQFLSALTETNM
jgi:hypothetical protein